VEKIKNENRQPSPKWHRKKGGDLGREPPRGEGKDIWGELKPLKTHFQKKRSRQERGKGGVSGGK